MSDTFVEKTTTGFFGNLGSAIKGVLVGAILFFLSFAVLWMNEGRTDMSQVAKLSAMAPSDKVETTFDGQFVSVTAALATDAQLEDPDFLYPQQALALHRNVEMYAWVEKKESKTEKKIGGSSETTTTYRYVQEWTSNPEDSSSFKISKDHYNPSLPVQSASWTADKANIGAYAFDPRESSLPSSERLPLTAELIRAASLSAEESGVQQAARPQPKLDGDYLFLGAGTLQNPTVGDVRISYSLVKPRAKATLFGKQAGPSLEPYVHSTGDRLFRVFEGNRDEAIQTLSSEHKMMGWLLRGLGFLMMWFGMSLFFGPVNAVLDVLPFLGSAGRTLVGVVLFPIALVLTGVTIVVAKVAHSPIALVVTLVLLIGGFVFFAKRRSAAKAAHA